MRELDPVIRRLQTGALVWCAVCAGAALAGWPDRPLIAASVVGGGVYDQSLVRVQKRSQAPYYTVTVTYDIAKTGLPAASIIPLPSGQIVRSSTVKLVDL